MEEGKTARVARSILNKVDDIYKKHPTMKHTILMFQKDIENIMNRMTDELKVLNEEEANMITISIINDIHRKVDEILLSHLEDPSGSH